MTDQTTKTQETQSSETFGIPSTSEYEFWKEKNSSNIFAVKSEQGQQRVYGPLSQADLSKSSDMFTYTENPQVTQNPSKYEKISHQEMRNQLEGVISSR